MTTMGKYRNITFTKVLCCQCQRSNPKGLSTR